MDQSAEVNREQRVRGGAPRVGQRRPDGRSTRDSKNPTGPVLLYTLAEWDAFLDGAKKGEFDGLLIREAS